MTGDGKDDGLRALLEQLDQGSEPKPAAVLSRYTDRHSSDTVELARRQLALEPSNLSLRDWLAFSLYTAGSYDEARQLYEECLALDDGNADQHYYLAGCDYALGDLAGAARHWRRAVELDPAGRCGRKALGKLESLSAS